MAAAAAAAPAAAGADCAATVASAAVNTATVNQATGWGRIAFTGVYDGESFALGGCNWASLQCIFDF